MPAGFTHMTLSRKSLDYLESEKGKNAKDILDSEIGFYLFGCVGPDIPYMGNFDNNPLSNNKVVADSLHYKHTNKLPLMGLDLARQAALNGDKSIAESLFAFFLGYTSHLIADGIIHPYIRDMVGDYEVAAKQHRTLEMKLDVLVSSKLMGVEINGVSLQNDLDYINESPNRNNVLDKFSQLINDIHSHKLSIDKIEDLLNGMKRALNMAEGQFPKWYDSFFGEKGAAYMDIEDVKKQEKDLINLTIPIDAKQKGNLQNFMKKNHVNFFEDVIPKYFSLFPPLIIEAYSYVFENGSTISELVPAINLDTGRLLVKQDLTETPALWV